MLPRMIGPTTRILAKADWSEYNGDIWNFALLLRLPSRQLLRIW
jgi:hypothetical protein